LGAVLTARPEILSVNQYDDFSDASQLDEVRSLSDEFTSVQDNLTLLVTHEVKSES